MRWLATGTFALLLGCKQDVYPQYTGSFELAEQRAVGMDGELMPRLLRITNHMRYVGGTFVHYLEFHAPDVPENEGRAKGHFVVSLTGLLDKGSTAVLADGQADLGGVEVLPDARHEDGGAYCYREASFRLTMSDESTYPAPQVLGRVYQGKTEYGGYQVSLSPATVSQAPIDEAARSEWISTVDGRGALQLTLVLERRLRTVMLGCADHNVLSSSGQTARVALVYRATDWHEDRDLRKGAGSYQPPSANDNRIAIQRFFQPMFGNPPVNGADR